MRLSEIIVTIDEQSEVSTPSFALLAQESVVFVVNRKYVISECFEAFSLEGFVEGYLGGRRTKKKNESNTSFLTSCFPSAI